MDFAFVLDSQGNPLMPTKRLGHVRHLLKDGKAKIVNRNPFTIQLKYESTHFIQKLYGIVEHANANSSVTVVNKKGEVIYEANNKEIPKLIAQYSVHSRNDLSGQHLVLKRKTKNCGT